MAEQSGTISERDSEHGGKLRAAQYLRMSTEHQRYSTENQQEVIARYAERRGITIVRTYVDEGKSGLKVDGRDALRRLIADVEGHKADFSLILVYDVSRWGRFQDVDESAYLEHVCKRAGVNIEYCAEQFENDGSLTAAVIKNIKRAMAGEYSRELSAKVFAGQCRLIELGFRQGGAAGYGLRRHLIDEKRQFKAPLRAGEHKSLQTDRVILVPGPPEEIAVVRRIFRQFVEERNTERQIADTLNREGWRTDLDRPWSRGTVRQILTNEKYIGNNVFNRTSYKLRMKHVRNPPEHYVRANGAFQAIIDGEIFDRARSIIVGRSRHLSDQEMLERLAELYRETGCLSALIIDESNGTPASAAYRARFGSLSRAYQLIGFSPSRDYQYVEINRFLRSLHPRIVRTIVEAIEVRGAVVQSHPGTDLLTINEEFRTSVVIGRCSSTSAGAHRWKIRFDALLRPDITIAARMSPGNQDILDYYLLPRLDFPVERLRLCEDNGLILDAYRSDTLEPFFELTRRTDIRRVA